MTSTPLWQPPAEALLSAVPPALKSHLLDSGSLTAKVRSLSGGKASVALLHHDFGAPTADEAERLNLAPGRDVLHRDIHLFGGPTTGQPWIFAHTVIPRGTLSGKGERLGQLGNKPLGEALFADPAIRRSDLELARLTPDHRLYALAVSHQPGAPAVIWGRRSAFYLSGGGSLLVAEFFLPAHPALAGE